MSPSDDIPFLDLAAPGFSTRGPQVAAARERHWCARTPWGLAVLRHREAGQILRDRRFRQGSHAWPRINGLTGSFAAFWQRSLIGQDGPAHRKLRAIAVPALSPDHIAALEPGFAAVAEELCAALPGDRCEFMHAFAAPFAGRVVCLLMGLDPSLWQSVMDDAVSLGVAMGLDGRRHLARINAACDRLSALAEDLIARAGAGGDETSYVARLVANANVAGDVTRQELTDLVVISIFGAVDTTRAQLGLAVALLADHPAQWAALRDDPGLAANAVEEAIRTRPTTTWATREALEDIPFGGLVIADGTTVHVLVHASARDPAICEDPAFDITVRRRNHFGFGGGAHSCLGAQVARADIAAALGVLARHWTDIRPDGAAEFLPETGNTGPVRLPLRVVRA